MINVNNRKLCENCFSETTASPCPHCGFDRTAYRRDPITLELGSVLNQRYLIGHVIGKGGFGITYLAYDLKLDSKIAIKEYYPMGVAIRNPGSMKVSVSNEQSEESFKSGAEKFYNEAKVVAKFNGNPNIVSVHDFFYENDTVYFTMGYLQGETLKSYLKRSRLTEGQAVRVMQDISNALLVSHSMNILHRDVSPDNIMLCDDGTIKLLDFGAARQVMAEQSQSLSVILKQGYAPLEQYQKRGKQGPWTDIYALGATIYNALTGVSIDDPMTRLEDDTEFESNRYGISDGLWQIIKKCMMVKISDRYQDIFELKKDLNSLGIEAEPITDVDVNAQDMPGFNTARSFENSAYDDNATELLEESSGSAHDNRTVALAPEAAAAYSAPVSVSAPAPAVSTPAPAQAPAPAPAQASAAGSKMSAPAAGNSNFERARGGNAGRVRNDNAGLARNNSYDRARSAKGGLRQSRLNKTVVFAFAGAAFILLASIITVAVLVIRSHNNDDGGEDVRTEVEVSSSNAVTEDTKVEETQESASEGIHRDTVYASVFGLSKSEGFGHDTDAKVKYYLTADDYSNEQNGDYAYMAVPNSAYVGNNYTLEDVNIKEYSDMDYPVITYFGIEIINDSDSIGSGSNEEETKTDAAETASDEGTGNEDETGTEDTEPADEYVDNHEYFVVKAPDGYVNLRTGPGKEYDIITPVNNGEYLQSLDESASASNGKKWVRVAWYADGHVEGWVIGSQVELVK